MQKTILITGGAVRVGALLANHLATKGHKIIITYNNSAKEAKYLKNKFNNLECYYIDLTDLSQIDAFWKTLNTPINILINNAAQFAPDTIENFNASQLLKHFTVNLMAPMIMTQKLIAQGGNCVINMLDKWAMDDPKNFLTYSLSKKSLASFTVHLKKDPSNSLRIFGIMLGFILYNKNFSKSFFDNNKDSYPSEIDNLLRVIDNILSDDKMHSDIIDLSKWKKGF